MRIIGALAILALVSACATTTPTSAPVPLMPAAASSSRTTTTTTTTTSSTPAVVPVELPADLAGKTAATVEKQLRAMGFTVFRYLAADGKQVTLDPSWTVVSVDGAGSSYPPDTVIVVRVDKPAPPKTTTKTTPKPAPPKPQPPAPQPPKPAQVYYKNCAAAKAAGAAPVRRGQPGYGSHLDRDGDGVGCEW